MYWSHGVRVSFRTVMQRSGLSASQARGETEYQLHLRAELRKAEARGDVVRVRELETQLKAGRNPPCSRRRAARHRPQTGFKPLPQKR